MGALYALGVEDADEQGRVLQALLDYVGDITLDQLAQAEMASGDAAPPPEVKTRRGGPLH